jgi:short-subunit dehydrogenase
MVDIRGRWAVVTGGSSGIGLAFANDLARCGANLLLISIQPAELASESRRIAQEYDVEVATLVLNLAEPNVAQTVLSFMAERGIVPYIFINNAGIFSFSPITETSEAKIQLFIDLHVRAVTELSRAVAILMEQQPAPDEVQNGAQCDSKQCAKKKARKGAQKGYILNMSSMSCWTPMPGLAMYAATKAYIRVFSRALAYELRDSGVRVLTCCPGGIATNLFGLPANLMRLALNLGFVTKPETFTHRAINRLLKGRMQYVNGLLNRISIVFVGVMPTSVRMLVKHKMLDKGISKP